MWLRQRVGLAESVAGMARPRIVRRIGRHAGAHRVEFDVAVAAEQIDFILHGARFVAAFPQGAGATVLTVDIAHIAAAERLHRRWHRSGLLAGEQQVHMVGHRHIGMHGNSELERKFVQILQVGCPVDVGKEAWLPAISPLHDMLGDAGEIQWGEHMRFFALRKEQRRLSKRAVPTGKRMSLGRESAL